MPLKFDPSVDPGTIGADPYVWNQTLIGTAGADRIEGAAGHDVIYGLGGNDTLLGWYGNDRLEGAAGDDVLYGSNGYDKVNGGEGNDSLHGGSDDDVLNGDAGADTLYGDHGNDWLDGGIDNDILYGHDGVDRMHGGDGRDTLLGGAHRDFLYGGNASDYLFGEAGDDRLFGGEGNDLLNGGRGTNYMSGGAGRDAFDFHPPLGQGGYSSDYNYVTDFELRAPGGSLGYDLINLTTMMDKVTNFTGTTADQAWAQGYLYFTSIGDSTNVYIDPNGKAPDAPPTHSGAHDILVVQLSNVARSDLGAIDGEFFGLHHHFLV
jgi:Ca2+-binding RTX toxin-like protein